MQVKGRALDYVIDTSAVVHLLVVGKGLYYMTCFP